MEYLSLLELCEGNLEGGSFTGVPEGYVKDGSGNGISLHRGPVGEPGVGSFTRDFERWMKEGSGNGASLSVGAL